MALEAPLSSIPACLNGLDLWRNGGLSHYRGPDGVEAFCQKLLKDSGVLLLPGSIYASELTATPVDCSDWLWPRASIHRRVEGHGGPFGSLLC